MFWRKPSSIIVQRPDGNEEVLEILDVTRQAQIALFGITLLITFVAWLISLKR